MSTIINVSAGAQEYVGGTITETKGKDISADTFEMALGLAPDAPTTGWSPPSFSAAGATPASKVVLLLVTDTTAPGTYGAWVRVTDTPEIVPRLVQAKIIVK